SSLAPLLNQGRDDTGPAAAGLLTTPPVLCLGLFAPLAPRLARRIGAERSVLLILFCLAGASIGIIGVLLPGIVKRDFPRQAGVMTGVYTMALCLGAALAAGAT
ncbi:cyanate transporter, partial [Pseudomonas aeruginosa]